jgi:uncharacterized protein with GYD domain
MVTIYATGRFTPAAMKAMIDNPTDRRQNAQASIEACGGRMRDWWITPVGELLVIVEFEDVSTPVAMAAVAQASGTVENLQIQRILTSEEFMAGLRKAKSAQPAYKPAI